MSPLPVLSAAPVTLRHIRKAAAGTTVVGATLAAQPAAGINGRRGYQSGSYEPALSEKGTAKVTLPNATGEDGVLHRRRFACLTDPAYEPGDEWVEVLQDGRVLFVGTPIDWEKTRTTITLDLEDGATLLEQTRSFAAGFWWHAPRDVFEHYTKAWRTLVADDFNDGFTEGVDWHATAGGDGTITNQATSVRMTVPSGAGLNVNLATYGSYWPTLNLVTSRAWRAECRFSQALVGSAGVAFLMRGGGGEGATIQTDSAGRVEAFAGNTTAVWIERVIPTTAADITLAIERHDRWIFFYAMGALVWAAEAPNYAVATAAAPEFSVLDYAGGASGYVDLDYIIVRDLQPYLMRGTDKGEYRLPSVPAAGGLRGSYYDEADLRPVGDTTADFYIRVLSPTRKPYARRQDATINFATASPPTWQPATPPSGAYFTARWTGSIYLDLATADVTLRLTSLDNGARLYVGKTMFGQHLLQQWANPTGAPYTLTSGSLRSHLGGAQLSGWYPLRLEYVQGTGSGGIILQQSIAGGTYAVVPATSLSPFGLVEGDVRYDSHAEQLRGIVEGFGYQYRLEPRALESGAFPGELVPRSRVGRDTDKVLEPPEASETIVRGSARESVATLLADAAGLADQANAAQLTAEAVDFPSLWQPAVADRHVAVATGYESLSDITDPTLLRTRLAAMLTLRTAPWEEVGARPRGHREVRDTFPPSFPIVGALALFDWEPGDGVRLRDPDLDLDDDSPRQIIAPAWPISPDGRGAPTVRFRQRPRSQQDALRALIRAVLLPQRNYQGQLVVINASLATSPATAYGDIYSRCNMPTDLSTIVSATFVLQYKGDTSTGTVTVNGVATTVTAQVAGRYDITPYVARITGEQRMYVNLAGHTSSAEYMVELLVRT